MKGEAETYSIEGDYKFVRVGTCALFKLPVAIYPTIHISMYPILIHICICILMMIVKTLYGNLR